MKKLVFALAIAAFVHVPRAEAVYVGTFTAGTSYSFEIVANSGVEWAVTFMSVARGRVQFDDIMTGNGNLAMTSIPVPAHSARVVVLIDTRGGLALVRINGGVPQEVGADPEARLVADVVP